MKKRRAFRTLFLVYLALLAALTLGAVLYVRALLGQYEASQPERRALAAVSGLAEEAHSGVFWERHPFPEPDPGPYEAGMDVRAAYLALWEPEALRAVLDGREEDGAVRYTVESDGFPVAKVCLRQAGPPVTKLAIFTLLSWETVSAEPVFQPRDYTLTLPEGFTAQVNGVPLEPAQAGGQGERTYVLSHLYTRPDAVAADGQGGTAPCALKGDRLVPELYQCSLTLPAALTVTLDGQAHSGEPQEDGQVCHRIACIKRPEIQISDRYGNVVDYADDSRLPLTSRTITASQDYTVKVQGTAVEADQQSIPQEYAGFAEFVPDLPETAVYRIAVLQEDADIQVADPQGALVPLPEGEATVDLTPEARGLEQVPAEILEEVDPLHVAQQWSLLMSNDLRFSRIAPYLIKGSYQYEAASRYATGVDITFTSRHTLANPAFTENQMTNFVQISPSCFSVDIRFIKHMRLGSGRAVDDPMHDRFYFVKYDDTDDNLDNPAWKLAGMKEILDDAGT